MNYLIPDDPKLDTVTDAVDFYLAQMKHQISPNGYNSIDTCLVKFRRDLGGMSLAAVKAHHLVDFVSSQEAWSTSTRRGVLMSARTCFNWLVHMEFIAKNPFKHIRVPRQTRRRAMTPAEFRAILRSTARMYYPATMKRLLIFLRLTGCRPGEAIALTWEDWDKDRGIVMLERHKTAYRTDKPRVIFLPPSAEKLLYWLEAHNQEDRALVFTREDGAPWHRRGLSRQFSYLRRRSGLQDDVKLYGIRHMFATEGLARGIPARIVAELLGHTSLAMLEIYAHLEGKVDLMRAAADQIATERAIKTWNIPTANQTREQNDELLATVRQLQTAVHALLAKRYKKPSSKASGAAPLPFVPVDSPAFRIMDDIQQAVFKLVTREPANIDQIFREADGLPVQAVSSALNLLSWRGHVVKLPGGFFRLPEKPRAKLEGGAA